jgi:hypothetical protein
VKILILLLMPPVWAIAQVELTVPGADFKASEPIPVKVKNAGKEQISYCVAFGQTPVLAQKRTGSKWSNLPSGADADSIKTLKVLGPGESQEFPFKMSDTGEVRLVLDYWMGATGVNCKHPPKGRKQAQSGAVAVRQIK